MLCSRRTSYEGCWRGETSNGVLFLCASNNRSAGCAESPLLTALNARYTLIANMVTRMSSFRGVYKISLAVICCEMEELKEPTARVLGINCVIGLFTLQIHLLHYLLGRLELIWNN